MRPGKFPIGLVTQTEDGWWLDKATITTMYTATHTNVNIQPAPKQWAVKKREDLGEAFSPNKSARVWTLLKLS